VPARSKDGSLAAERDGILSRTSLRRRACASGCVARTCVAQVKDDEVVS
jgi:hypothetical protein